MTSLDFMHRVLVFDGLSDEQLAQVEACCKDVSFERNQRIFADGQKADHLYFVLEGKVDLRFEVAGQESSARDTITSLRQAQTFGWSALMHSPIYSLSAYCASDACRLVQVAADCLFKLFRQDTAMGYIVMTNVAEVIRSRFHQLQEELSRRKGLPTARY